MAVLIAEWPHRPNVDFRNPSEIDTFDKGKKRFRFTFSVRKKITMYISFPKDGGVRIHNGKRGMFEPDDLCDIVYEQLDGNTLKMTGNGTSAVLSYLWDKWSISIYDRKGELKNIISSKVGRWGYSNFRVGINIEEEHALMYLDLPISKNEEFFGTGERFNSFSQNGKKIMMWNVDIGCVNNTIRDEYCDKPQGYKNIPFIHSTKGYSIFFNTYLPVEFDIGNKHPERFITEIYGDALDMYIWTDSAKESVKQYHRLTGTPFVPPRWAFDYWIGGGWPIWNTPDSSVAFKNISNVLDKYEENGVRVSNAYLETDPTEETLGGLRDRGLRTFMWTNSCLEIFGESNITLNDYRVKKASNPKEVMAYNYIDFTSPESLDVICEKFDNLWDLGVCGEMVDFADSMPEDAICSNGKTGTQMHNEYAYWYGKRMNQAFTERLGKDFVLFQRSGCAGSQHNTASFGGDIISDFLGLKRTVWQILSASSSGISIWGSDTGGFYITDYPVGSREMEELYIRWVQFSTFSPLMRDHSWDGHHNPWANGEKGLQNFKNYYALRLSILDAVYSAALKSEKFGGTVVESMAVAYGMSPKIDNQYMFCGDFLVRPVIELDSRKVKVAIPENGFYGFYDGKYYKKGKTEVEAPLMQMPVFIKSGSVIPFNYYNKDIIPTYEKENYEKALLLTPPEYSRESVVYSENKEEHFVSEPYDKGFIVKSNTPCDRKVIILHGAYVAEISSDADFVSVEREEETNRTVIRVQTEWTTIKVRTQVK